MPSYLSTGQYLRTNEYLVAANGSCFAIMQTDGNFCLYEGSGPAARGKFLWSSLSQSRPQADYYAVMQADGNFCVYQGVPGGASQFVWATGSQQPATGSFVAAVENGANFTVSAGAPDKPAEQRLLWAARRVVRVITYNTHLIEGSNIEVGAWFKNLKPVVLRDEERHRFLVERIKQSGADVVALQEVWSAERMDRIREDLKAVYPYSDRGTNGPATKAGSGIVLVSKFPLENGKFVEYTSGQVPDEDSWASKGALADTLVLEPGVKLRVGSTHMWTNAGGPNSDNVRDLIRETGEDKLPGILLGDFNIHRISDPVKYKDLNTLMTGARARDSWTWVHGDGAAKESCTDDPINNTLDQFFSPCRDTPNPDCIDYAYLRNGDSISMRPISARVLRDWKYPTNGSPYWYWVHSGTTANLPSAAAFGRNLCVAARTNEGRLLVGVFDSSTRKWTHKLLEEGGAYLTCGGSPSVVWYFDTLHLFFQQGGQVYKMESRDGLNWTPKNSQGSDFCTSGGLCAVVHCGTLLVFARDPRPNSNGVCYYEWTNRWSERRFVIGMNTRHDIAAAVLDDVLCVVTRDDDGGSDPRAGVIRALRYADGRWSTVAQTGVGAETTGSPGITAKDGKFEVYYREKGGGGIFHRSSTDGSGWSAEDFTGHATTDQVCAVAWEGKVLLFFPFVVNSSDHLLYPQRALAHAWHPAGVDLDASDHYPYMVELVWSPAR